MFSSSDWKIKHNKHNYQINKPVENSFSSFFVIKMILRNFILRQSELIRQIQTDAPGKRYSTCL